MKSIKILSFATAILATSSIYAETKTPAPYGDNPNIFKVLAHKTGEKIQNTAERVGAAAERGVEKIKPKVDNAWEETKTFTEQQTERAKTGVQKGAEKVTETANNTRDAIVGTNQGTVPIERGRLSQSSSTTTTQQATSTQVANTAAQTTPLETTTSTVPVAHVAKTIDPTQQNGTAPEEPEISFKSLPLPQASNTTDSTQPSAQKEDLPQ